MTPGTGNTHIWGVRRDTSTPTPHIHSGSCPNCYIQVILALKGLAANFAHVLPLLAVCQVVLAKGAGAAEHLPTQAAV